MEERNAIFGKEVRKPPWEWELNIIPEWWGGSNEQQQKNPRKKVMYGKEQIQSL